MPDDFSSIPAYVAQKTAATGMNTGTVTMDFGNVPGHDGDTCSLIVIQDWVTSTSRITVNLALTANADHDPEDAILEEIKVVVLNKTAGQFNIFAYAPNGTFGKYDVTWSGR